MFARGGPSAAVLAVIGLLGSSCAGKKAPPPEPPPLARSRPALAEVGLEVATVATPLDQAALARALLPYLGDLPPVPGDLLTLWRAHGMRLVSVPLDRVDALTADLGAIGSMQRQWFGQALTWTEVVHGPERTRSQTILLDSGRLELGPGRLRLLARCWIVPVPGLPITEGTVRTADSRPEPAGAANAALHIEIVPQHQERARAAADLLAEPNIGAERDGMLFSRLLMQMTVPAGHAFIIVPERPDADWGLLARTSPDESAAASPAPPPGRRVGQVTRAASESSAAPAAPMAEPSGPSPQAGPPGAVLPTIGQVMLGGDAAAPASAEGEPGSRVLPGRAPIRRVLILIPKVPGRYRLLSE